MNGLLAALGFLTRVPVPSRVFADAEAQRRSPTWYPAVGLLLGAALAALAWWARHAPALPGAALVLLVWVAATGALHLDGLADSADAWIGGIGSRERTLAIMKDPRSGPAGVVALVLALLAKFAGLAGAWPHAGWTLLLAPMLARAGLTVFVVGLPYARESGLGSPLRQAPRRGSLVALSLSALLCLCVGVRGMLALTVAALVTVLWGAACRRRLGGYTGDAAGALAEGIEAAVLLALGLLG